MGTFVHTQVQASTTHSFTPVQTGLFKQPAAELDLVDPAHEQATAAFDGKPASGGANGFRHNFGQVGVLQAKLTVGAPGDRYEQEADRVADQVLAAPEPQPVQRRPHAWVGAMSPRVQRQEGEEQIQARAAAFAIAPHIQRQEGEEEIQTKSAAGSIQREAEQDELQTRPALQRQEEEEEVQAKLESLQRQEGEDEEVQAKPEAIQRQDEDEELQTKPATGIQREAAPEEDEEVQTKPVAFIQREAAPEEEEQVQTKPTLQRRNRSGGSLAAPPSMESRLAGRKGSGAHLSPEVRAFMEPRFGADFSGVRVHTGAEAVQMNQELRAQAFTHGSDIYFADGKYDPGSSGGKQLLAHELTHVVQQTGGVQRKPSTGRPLPSITSLSGGLVQREVAVCEPPASKAPVAPTQDPKFEAVGGKIHQTGSKAKQHPPAKAKADEAQNAAVGPPNEVASQGAANQVGKMEQAKSGTFDKAAFVAAVHQAIERITPQNLEQADDFKQSGKAGELKAEVANKVGKGKDDSARDVKETSQAAPDSADAKPKDVTPLAKTAPDGPPAKVNAETAMPGPKSAAETSLAHGQCGTDQMMKEANVTEDQLKKSNEPEFTGAVDAKKQADADAKTAPQAVKTSEAAVLGQAKAGAGGQAEAGTAAMHSKKAAALAKVMGQQETTKGKDEGERAKVSAKLQELYNTTKEDVTKTLDGLEGKVNTAFDSGEQAARSAFENHVDTRMRKYKDERYGGVGGGLLWLKDKVLGMPSEVNAFYKEGRSLYLKQMDAVINLVANVVAAELGNAKRRIAQGRLEVKQYIDGLPKNLRKLGLEAQEKVQDQFGELDRSVDEKQNGLIDSLAQRYVAARDTVDKRIDEMKAANQGLVNRAMEALGGVIETILKLKEMLAGVLAKAAGVLDKIIKDPMQFLSNLLAAVKQGFNMFVGNITAHLKKGLIGWLMGTLADAGIELPESFDLKGILKLVTSVIGLTYANIRSRAVSMVGEKVVAGIEKAAEIFIILKNEGISGVWKLIQDKLSDIKETVMGGIKDFVITKIITSAVTWIISLFNPASAFIKACKMIYDVVMFFVERGSQIMSLVNSILDSIGAIADGAIGGAAAMVEQSLAKALPVAISFLASLLGIGGIAGKIKELIEKVQAPVNKAVDWLVTNVVGKFKKLFGKGIAKAKGFVDKAKAKGKAIYEKGKQKVKAAGDWAKGKAKAAKDKLKDKLGIGKQGDKKPDERTPEQLQESLSRAVSEAELLLENEKMSHKQIEKYLPGIKSKYKLTSLKLVTTNNNEEKESVHVEAEINPKMKSRDHILTLVKWPPSSLPWHEKNCGYKGGHAMARHVDRTSLWLLDRSLNDRPGDVSSGWKDNATANSIIFGTIFEDRRRIARWLVDSEEPSHSLQYRGSASNPVGYGHLQDYTEGFPLWLAVIVLRRHGSNSFCILTAYPTDKFR
jgi:hypothetical protein